MHVYIIPTFRCQIIAHALGGEVDYNPNKMFILKAETLFLSQPKFSNLLIVAGTKYLARFQRFKFTYSKPKYLLVYVVDNNCFHLIISNKGKSEELSSSSSGSNLHELNIIVSHGDCVKILPPDGLLLAHSDSCEHEIFIIGKGLTCHSTTTSAGKYVCIKAL